MDRRKVFLLVIVVALVTGGLFFVLERGQPEPKQTSPPTSQTSGQQPNQQQTAQAFDKNRLSHDDPTSIWVVVNKTRPLSPKTYAPDDLVAVTGSTQRLRKEPAEALERLIKDARKENLIINPLSGYRSYDTQVTVYGNEVKSYGQTVADTESARPGYSEHQTGLAIDVGGGGCGIEDCFGKTAEGKWLAVNAYKYGFIIRYTSDKQQVTGYRAEPWHIRYIGTNLSSEMKKQGVTTLEEFFGLPAAPEY